MEHGALRDAGEDAPDTAGEDASATTRDGGAHGNAENRSPLIHAVKRINKHEEHRKSAGVHVSERGVFLKSPGPMSPLPICYADA
jgi:hypothetical protein